MELGISQIPASNDSGASSDAFVAESDRDLRPRPGFHKLDLLGTDTPRLEAAIFYVTVDGRVFLLRGPDEPACLHRCHAMPTDATPVLTQVDPELELLANTADSLGRQATARIQALRAEVRRDRMIAAAALLQETLACVQEELGHLLLAESCPDPADLHERLVERLRVIDLHRRLLNDQRINKRGEPARDPAPAHVPAVVAPFIHRGEYVGWFMDMEAAGAQLAGPFAERSAEGATRIRDAHLRGELWTVVRDGLVHVFRCPSTSATNTHTSKET